jgi:hypothetical protein
VFVIGYNNPPFKGGPIPTGKNHIWPKKRQKNRFYSFFRNVNDEEKKFCVISNF